MRRHPCPPHRRYRPDLGDRRKRGRLRRAPHRGADRASRAQACQRHHGAGEDRGARAAHLDRRRAGAHRRADGRAQEARARPVGCAQEARDGRRRDPTDRRRRRRRARSRRRQAAGARGRGRRDQGSQEPRRRRQEADRLRAWSRSSASPRTARPASSSASPPISPRASTRSDLVRKGSEALGGKGGGGRPDMAQAGGPDGAKAAARRCRRSKKPWPAPRVPVAIVRASARPSDPDLRDRLYELLEHDHLPYSVGSRFVRLIVGIIVIDVRRDLASVPEFDARSAACSPSSRSARWQRLRWNMRRGCGWPATRRGNCRRRGTASNMRSQASASSTSGILAGVDCADLRQPVRCRRSNRRWPGSADEPRRGLIGAAGCG